MANIFEQLFGIDLKRKESKGKLEAFNLDRRETGEEVVIDHSYTGGVSVLGWNMLEPPAEERELINSYRELSMSSEVDEALQEIRNEIFIFDIPGERAFELAFTEEKGAPAPSIQKKIIEEFHNLYDIVEFRDRGIEYFDDWYINSKLYLHKLVDANNPKLGIQGVSNIDPLKIRKVKIIPRPDANGVFDTEKIREIYVFSNNFGNMDSKLSLSKVTELTFGTNVNGLEIAPEAITYVDSGLYDRSLGRYVGYLKKAIVPFNNLRMIENAMLIFRVVRAPQRRAFYIDVSSMQKNKAEEYMRDLMSRFKTKVVYDSKTGQLTDRRNIHSMLEDYWLPRRDNGRTTEIQTLDGQDSQNIIQEVEYYRDRLWRSLNVPVSRFSEQPTSLVFGRGIEIQRDEYRFRKFLDRLRQSFMRMFDDLLLTQLVLKKIIKYEEWEDIRRYIFWNFAEDNSFVEYKESELINNRVTMLSSVESYVGKYFSEEWVRRKILRQTEADIKAEDERMESERERFPERYGGARDNELSGDGEGEGEGDDGEGEDGEGDDD